MHIGSRCEDFLGWGLTVLPDAADPAFRVLVRFSAHPSVGVKDLVRLSIIGEVVEMAEDTACVYCRITVASWMDGS